jgi:hypothetical protein
VGRAAAEIESAPSAQVARRATRTELELSVHFYELHEGDDDQFADLLLARETEMEPDVFFDIVQTIRRRIEDSFEQDTLIEAIADELERDYDFLVISDDRLTAAVNVSRVEDDNFLAELAPSDSDDADEDDEDGEDDEFRSLLVDLERNPDIRPN